MDFSEKKKTDLWKILDCNLGVQTPRVDLPLAYYSSLWWELHPPTVPTSTSL